MSLSSLEQTLKSSPPPGRRRADAARAFAPPVRRRSHRLTKEGALFILLSLLIGLAAVNSGHNLLYLIFSVMLAMMLISGILARMNLRRVEAIRHYPLEFHCGQDPPAHIEIRNRGRWTAAFGIRAEDFLIHEQATGLRADKPVRAGAFAPIVRRGQSVLCQTHLNPPRRGLYRLVSIQLSSRYPFGFFLRSHRVDSVAQILVFPRMAPAHSIGSLIAHKQGDREADRKGQGASLYGVRNYQMGDPARLIHWKHSAKGQGLKLKEFEEERTRTFRLLIDLRCGPRPDDATLERMENAISVAATLARALLHNNSMVGLWTTYGRVPAGYGRAQLQRILRALARLEPQPWDAEIPILETEPPETVHYQIVFQDAAARPAEIELGWRRPAGARVIDVRTIDFTPIQKGSHANGH